jgi:uncharacterized protein (DUF2236 family)
MVAVIQAVKMIESVASLHFPPKADQLLQDLMDRNTNGLLTPEDRKELASLVELREAMALVRAQALHLLGRKPT